MTQITNDMLTDWFSRDARPVRSGLYETRIAPDDPVGVIRLWMNGAWWFEGQVVQVRCAVQRREWRGLTEEAKLYLSWPWDKWNN